MRVKFLKTLDFDLQPELILIGTYENSIMSSFIDSKIYGNIANVATMYYFITFHCTVRQSVLLSQAGMKIRNFFSSDPAQLQKKNLCPAPTLIRNGNKYVSIYTVGRHEIRFYKP